MVRREGSQSGQALQPDPEQLVDHAKDIARSLTALLCGADPLGDDVCSTALSTGITGRAGPGVTRAVQDQATTRSAEPFP